jgi:Flp pilus assembly protein TadG
MVRGHRGTGNTLRLFGRLRAFGAEISSVLGDRGAVAVEFAFLFFPLMLMFWGIFGVGYVMIQDLQLNFIVEQAAKLEVEGGDAKTYATAQIPWASFTYNNPSPCGGPPPAQAAQVIGTWPVSLGVADAVTFNLSAQACALK